LREFLSVSLQAELCSLVQAPTEQTLDSFKQQHGLWLGFRAQPGGATEEIAAMIEMRFDGEKLSAEPQPKQLTIAFNGQQTSVPRVHRYRQCYAELRAINQLLEPKYEIRLVKDSVDEGVHCFCLATRTDWEAAEHHGDVGALFTRISAETDFALGPIPTLSVWFAELLTRAVEKGLIKSTLARR
jgi:hypothetical protein